MSSSLILSATRGHLHSVRPDVAVSMSSLISDTNSFLCNQRSTPFSVQRDSIAPISLRASQLEFDVKLSTFPARPRWRYPNHLLNVKSAARANAQVRQGSCLRHRNDHLAVHGSPTNAKDRRARLYRTIARPAINFIKQLSVDKKFATIKHEQRSVIGATWIRSGLATRGQWSCS